MHGPRPRLGVPRRTRCERRDRRRFDRARGEVERRRLQLRRRGGSNTIAGSSTQQNVFALTGVDAGTLVSGLTDSISFANTQNIVEGGCTTHSCSVRTARSPGRSPAPARSTSPSGISSASAATSRSAGDQDVRARRHLDGGRRGLLHNRSRRRHCLRGRQSRRLERGGLRRDDPEARRDHRRRQCRTPVVAGRVGGRERRPSRCLRGVAA